jgi:CBS domain-containing protein
MKVKELIEGQKLITAETHAELGEIASLMALHQVSGIPIVDEWGGLAGLVSGSDLLRLATPQGTASREAALDTGWSPTQRTHEHDPQWQRSTAESIMATELCTVEEDTDIRQAARAMTMRNVHRAVVLGKDRNVTGMLSSMDLTLLLAVQPPDSDESG